MSRLIKPIKGMVGFNEYQREARLTALPVDGMGHPVIYPTMGLANEAGEVAGKVKKIFRDKGGEISEEDRQALKKELGDVLWYLSQVADTLDIALEDIAYQNLTKLLARQIQGTIQGEGDNR